MKAVYRSASIAKLMEFAKNNITTGNTNSA